MKKIFLLFSLLLLSVVSYGQSTWADEQRKGIVFFNYATFKDSCIYMIKSSDHDTLKISLKNDKVYITCKTCDSIIFTPNKTNIGATDLSNYVTLTGAQTVTNKNLTTGNAFPTFNQNTTGTSGGLSSNILESQVTGLVTDLAGKEPANANIQAHIISVNNPHSVTKTQIGLSNAENTSDLNKVISTLTQTALNGKASTNHATSHITGGSDIIPNAVAAGNSGLMIGTDKTKLDGIAAGATVNSTDAALRARSSHTGTQTASTISDFDATVTANASVVANTAKVTNATHTGDATGATALTVVKINGTLLSGLATGILKNTTVTGVPSIALAGTDYLTPSGSAALLTSFPTLNQNTTGTAGGLSANIAESQVTNLVSDLASKASTSTLKQGAYLSDTTKFPLTTSLRQGAYLSDTTKFAPSTGIANSALANTAVANLSGTNTGDNAANSLYSGLVSNATHTGDATGSTALTVVKINGTLLSGLATGLLKNTTTTGVPSIAIGSDIPNISESQVTNLVTDLAAKAPTASPTFTGTVTLPASQVVNGVTLTTAGAATNFLTASGTYTATPSSDFATYRTILNANGSHIAAKVGGTYAMGYGDPIAITGGTGTLYPLAVVYLSATDFPTVNGLSAKLRIRAELFTNDVAPTGNFTFGLYPITRPAISGGAGLNIYTLGTVVTGSNGATFTAPAADALLVSTGVDFAMPADGFYVIGIVTTATIATSSLVHLSAQLQTRYN